MISPVTSVGENPDQSRWDISEDKEKIVDSFEQISLFRKKVDTTV